MTILFVPSVVLPRPAWQEKAHCVAAGSFFLFSYLSFLMFIIHMQVPFVIFITFYIYYSCAGSEYRHFCFDKHGFISICWPFHVSQVSFIFVFRDHFPPFQGVDLFQRVDKNVEADFGWTSLLHNWDSHTLKLDNLIVWRPFLSPCSNKRI